MDRPPLRGAARKGRLLVRALLVLLLLVPATPAIGAEDFEDERGARALRGQTWSSPVTEPEDITRAAPVHPMTPPYDELHRSPSYYADGCHVPASGTTVLPGCTYGPGDATVRVAVVGDSKVGGYFPALQEIAHREGWQLRMYTKSSCGFVLDSVTPGYPECDTYNRALRAKLDADPPDLVLTGSLRRDAGEGYVATWNHLRSRGVERIVALWDLPGPDPSPNQCVADALRLRTDLLACATVASDSRSGNPSLREAAARVDGADFVDLRDWVCPPSPKAPACAPVVGRVQVYAQGSHMVDRYAATLTDPVHQRLFEIGVAAHAPAVDRVGGANRYATAAMLSRDVAPGRRVWVASGLDYPDALAAAARAGHDSSAVLLVRATDVPSATREALVRLAPSEIVVVGGTLRIEDPVLQVLRSYSPRVRRLAGTNRYATAAEIATWGTSGTGGQVYVASGEGYADALAAAAQAGADGSPVLLVRADRVPSETAAALGELRPRRVIVVGGELAVQPRVMEEVRRLTGATTTRVSGPERYSTAAALAAGTAAGGVLHISVADNYADALAAAPASAAAQGAVLLVTPRGVPGVTARAIRDIRPGRIVVTGGAVAVPKAVEHALFDLLP